MEQDPLFHETDPRIRIHIKMKRIRNTASFVLFFPPLTSVAEKKTDPDLVLTLQGIKITKKIYNFSILGQIQAGSGSGILKTGYGIRIQCKIA